MADARIIALLSLKGGVGKTTSAVNIACCLADAGKKTLLVDLDPYTGATAHLGIPLTPDRKTIADVLCDPKSDISEAVYETAVGNLSIAVSDESLASCESEFHAEIGRESLLLEHFAGHENHYDFVIMDLPPLSPFLMVNALRMAREVLVPFRTAYLDLKVAGGVDELVEKVRRRLNPAIRILGYFGTMSDLRTKESRQSVEDMRKIYGGKVFKTVIPASTRVAAAPRRATSAAKSAGSSNAAKAYKSLVREIFDL
jgi:chromosome partitioning protein